MVSRPALGGDTLFDEYAATTGKDTHPIPALTGQVTCYGGPALDGDVPVELYVRRAVDARRARVTVDLVAIFPDDLVPQRRMIHHAAGAGVANVGVVGGDVIGRVLADGGGVAAQIVRAQDAAQPATRPPAVARFGGWATTVSALTAQAALGSRRRRSVALPARRALRSYHLRARIVGCRR